MANNSGRVVVYGEQDKNSAMYAAMFGGFDENKGKNKREKEVVNKGEQKIDKSLAPQAKSFGSDKFVNSNRKNTPVGSQGSSNVKGVYVNTNKKGGGSYARHVPSEKTESEIREKTVRSVKGALKDLGDKVVMRTLLNDVIDYTEVLKPDGDEIVLKIEQDAAGSPTDIVISEEGGYLYEYIESQASPGQTRRWISGLVNARRASGVTPFGVDIYFDGKSIFVRGDKRLCVEMKWALLDLLAKIYDRDMDIW